MSLCRNTANLLPIHAILLITIAFATDFVPLTPAWAQHRLAGQEVAANVASPIPSHQNGVVLLGHGTLDVAIATPRFIVVATDSRRTCGNGYYDDTSKKLFVIGKKRVLAIAGLATISRPDIPGLTAQIAPLLDMEIKRLIRRQEYDDDYWNDPTPPIDLPENLKEYFDHIPYRWWTSLRGPLQTITNILAAIGEWDLNRLTLVGILAGFKDNGDAKIERFTMVPVKNLSNFGRTWIGISEIRDRESTAERLIWKTAGVTQLADTILGGLITPELEKFAQGYPGITTFLKMRKTNSVQGISVSQAVDLAKDLIRATASCTPTVGATPIQIAIIRPKKQVIVRQRAFPKPGIFLTSDGTWNLGVVFTPGSQFDQSRTGCVYTFCEIKDNTTPIPLGDNYFYGNDFERTTFIYTGGKVSFGNNNCKDSKLLITPSADKTQLSHILSYFTQVIQQKN